MLIAGNWFLCDDGVLRPTLLARVQAADGSSQRERFLVDTDADRTVLSGQLLTQLRLPEQSAPEETALAGVGGTLGHVIVNTVLEFTQNDGTPARVRGDFAAFKDPTATDLSILGRDILVNFDLVVSRKRDELCLLAGRHQYRIEAT